MTAVLRRGAVVLVTGAGSGIGRATAVAFAARGATVVCVDIDEVTAKATVALCAGTGARAYAADVADRDAVAALAERVTRDVGVPDVLVNNAGVGLSGPFLDTPLEDWDWIVGVNLFGVVHLCSAFGAAMVARGSGHVINVSSGLAYTYRPTEGAYSATKAAVLALSRSLRTDWGPSGVGVSAICPGVINTPIIAHTRMRGEQADPEATARASKLFSRGHPPERVAQAIIRAVERDRAVVPVGFEAWLAWLMHRLLPTTASDRLMASTQRLTSSRR